MIDFFICKKKSEETKEKEKENKEKEHEKEEHQKALRKIAKNYKKNKEILNDWNHLKKKYETKKEEEDSVYSLNNLFGVTAFEKINSQYTKDKIKYLTTDRSSEENGERKDVSDIFFLTKYALQFLPAFVRIEVIILYGCFEIYKHITRFFIVNNNITMNEKINFQKILVNIHI